MLDVFLPNFVAVTRKFFGYHFGVKAFQNKRISFILPITIQHKLGIDYKRKANHFKYYASKCTSLNDDSSVDLYKSASPFTNILMLVYLI